MANDLRASTNKHAYCQRFGLLGWAENGLKWQTIASLMSPHVRAGTDENDLITVRKCDRRRLKCKRTMYNITLASDDDGDGGDTNSSKNNKKI